MEASSAVCAFLALKMGNLWISYKRLDTYEILICNMQIISKLNSN